MFEQDQKPEPEPEDTGSVLSYCELLNEARAAGLEPTLFEMQMLVQVRSSATRKQIAENLKGVRPAPRTRFRLSEVAAIALRSTRATKRSRIACRKVLEVTLGPEQDTYVDTPDPDSDPEVAIRDALKDAGIAAWEKFLAGETSFKELSDLLKSIADDMEKYGLVWDDDSEWNGEPDKPGDAAQESRRIIRRGFVEERGGLTWSNGPTRGLWNDGPPPPLQWVD
jgi:hypothetical protein